jgi:hypothetical protein
MSGTSAWEPHAEAHTAYRAGPVARRRVLEDRTMYQKPSVQRFGTFRDLTQFGCIGLADAGIPGVGPTDGGTPEFTTGPDGVTTTKVCFSPTPPAASGM